VTTDPRDTFADGLPTGGDVTANWTVLDPMTIASTNGVTFTKLSDLSILADGPTPDTDVYTVTASTALGGVTGIRLATPGEAAAVAIVSREAQAAPESADIELTPREHDVLVLMAEGASNKAIARQLGISVHTAKFHVGSLLDKLDATGRTDAVAHAARRGVIHL
jgi:DNA-binding CsgD family transcriptional regulator